MNKRLLRYPISTAVLFAIVGSYPLFLVSAYAGRIQLDLAATKSQFGWAAAAYFAAGSIGSFQFGKLVDRYGTRFGGVFATVGGSVAMLIIGLGAKNWIVLAAALSLTGFANVAGQVAGNRIVAAYVDQGRQGLGFGAKQAAVPLGTLIAGAVVALLGSGAPWRTTFVVSAFATLALVVFAPEFGAVSASDRPVHFGVGRDARSLIALGIAGALLGATGNALAVLVADSFGTAGFDESVAASVLAFGGASAVVGRVLVGWVVDRRGTNGFPELVTIVVIGAFGFATLATAGTTIPLLVIGVALGFAAGWGWPAVIYFVTSRNSTAPPGTSTGFVLTGVFFGAVVGPPLFATIAERSGYATAWGTAAAMTALALVGIGASRLLSVVHRDAA